MCSGNSHGSYVGNKTEGNSNNLFLSAIQIHSWVTKLNQFENLEAFRL